MCIENFQNPQSILDIIYDIRKRWTTITTTTTRTTLKTATATTTTTTAILGTNAQRNLTD